MPKQRIVIGLALSLGGVATLLLHAALAVFSAVAERFHGHEILVGLALVAALIGLSLLYDEKRK